jgi:ferredoxin, 2Fe-2S
MKCKMRFEPSGKVMDVDTDKPAEGVGKAGTLLNIALANGLEIEHPCDGEGTCGLCAVEIVEGKENLSEVAAEEQDVLATADPPNPRLACQAVVKGNVTCRLP